MATASPIRGPGRAVPAIVDGDAKVYTIACASVVAKVVRDRMMTLLAARYPGYGWEHNQGYATQAHRDAIRRQGLTPFHRRSFLALQRTLAGDQISLDLFDEEVTEAASAEELGELIGSMGLHTRDRPARRLRPGADAAAAIAAAAALVGSRSRRPTDRLTWPAPRAPAFRSMAFVRGWRARGNPRHVIFAAARLLEIYP